MLLSVRLISSLGAVALVAAVDLFGSQSLAEQAAMMLPTDPAPLVAVTDEGDRNFSIEIADDAAERSAGLMFRETMPEDHGMLFVMDNTDQVGFWMQNTPMPLDLLFIGPEGKVKRIMRGEPMSEAVISPGEPVRFVLELKAGTAKRVGIESGDIVRHPVITAVGNSG